MKRSKLYVTSSERLHSAAYSIVSVALTTYAGLIASEFLYNGIRFTKGPQMAFFVLPVIPVFIAVFIFSFVGPMIVRKHVGTRGFHRNMMRLLGWQALSCGIIGAVRLLVLNGIFQTGLTSTIGLLGAWFMYATVLLSAVGIALLAISSKRP